ncbi:GntR family transcriptional regulator (plasmid) [Prescottella equi]|uniref:GntR family transcriptional regulator n=1 Tax=Rhodococcus hoagii TaxID=43767 RepID=UPI002575A5FF|nr:GntR family transcriptional regulator [Prescottella equi]WJJ14518.1 GntR family transcriptional regulator [Prescottella equi]
MHSYEVTIDSSSNPVDLPLAKGYEEQETGYGAEMSMLPKYAAMREYLLDEIRSGRYRTGDQLPSLDALNIKFDAVGPATGTRAYSELVKLGMVEHRYGLGYFFLSATPLEVELERHRIPALVRLDSIEAALRSAFAETRSLRKDSRPATYVVEFQDKRTGERFGESLHPSRLAAERFAVEILTRLGEDASTAMSLASAAGSTICDGRLYGVQISARTTTGANIDIRHGHREDHSND